MSELSSSAATTRASGSSAASAGAGCRSRGGRRAVDRALLPLHDQRGPRAATCATSGGRSTTLLDVGRRLRPRRLGPVTRPGRRRSRRSRGTGTSSGGLPRARRRRGTPSAGPGTSGKTYGSPRSSAIPTAANLVAARPRASSTQIAEQRPRSLLKPAIKEHFIYATRRRPGAPTPATSSSTLIRARRPRSSARAR